MSLEPIPAPVFASFWQRRVVAPLLAQLRQGITPQKIALTVALGIVLGIFPVFGATTVLCAVAALWLRLNQPVIQLVNYAMSPVHFLLMLPFWRAGESLFGQEHLPLLAVGELIARFEAAPGQFVLDYSRAIASGIGVWALVAPVLAGLIYLIARPLLRALVQQTEAAP
ncbi:DUF2062 domain-containing protein [Sinimarinibacterium sp. NLF-5-8]|uniref:DUF2062 domain-containing protein n=1 Tax=Sinimarinibacterium sp. NLF-5-8 TaxID=2698684 RepID=UPI00137BA6AE|nr:DUF2062 domain-containing protein [Sinimarinibacterium sp. NLF-5-8]QHS10440.1 DUF2062 domain-containing protein [Sinimarinibacterium sp. NLF-5-8]